MARPLDVCIRGGGITGRSLALLLARERLQVGLAVQNAPLTADVRAYALNHQSRRLLEAIRCWPQESAATPVLTMQVYGDDGGEVVFKASDSGTSALTWIVDVPVLESQLAQASSFQPQIELLDSPRPATLTIVCEGKASRSREEFGVDFDVSPYRQLAIAARLQCEKPHLQTARQWFFKGGILGVLPLDGPQGNSVAIVLSVDEAGAQSWMDMDDQTFASEVQVKCQDVLGGMAMIGQRAAWPLQLAKAHHWVGNSQGAAWALAGDAAHTVHPLSGQGLNLGLGDAAELAALIAARDYWRSVADEKLLRRYERARKSQTGVLSTATDGLQRLFSASGTGWQALRNKGMSSFERSGPLKNWVARQAMGA